MGAIRFGGCLLERDQACAMRDGTVLYADIYRPSQDGCYPVLLMRQPYGKMLASTVSQAHPVWYARQGFIVVIQDVRGRGDSEGEFDPFAHEAEDGYDTVQWAAALPQSNGYVGMYGFSYQGSTQWAAASLAPPALKAIAPGMCGASAYHGMIYPQGRFAAAEHVPWAFQLARDGARRAGDAESEAYCTLVRKSTPDELLYPVMADGSHPILQRYFPAYGQWREHADYDAYWERRSWMNAFLEHPIPAFLIGGWYDVFLMGTLEDYDRLSGIERTDDLFFKLMIGPWDHIPWGRHSGGMDHGREADGDIHAEQAAWFRYWLDPQRKPKTEAEPEVRGYERGSGAWRSYGRESPLSSQGHPVRLWLNGGIKPANGALGGGRLLPQPTTGNESAPDVFVYDARMPMTLDGFQPKDRRAEQDRYEILVYTGEPLAECVRLFGAITLQAQVQTIGGPTDLVAIASVVGPSGEATFLTAGVAEASAEADEQGLGQTLQLKLRPVAIELRPGEAIRLELTGSAYPLYARHPNGRSISDERSAGPGQLRMATVSIHYEGSTIELPVRVKGGEATCTGLAMAETTGM
ncbi:CocE/NonD family hydrolase [Paenibacillus arenilitoris]|uniref:CocE/NonD family hydrolase n=1 Tax=Paenibacillus arenilitoris TaxID=2772299 RepID=A0A927CL95_9BACL|nr:CocE/NonD family hydrolase [Paenibacillus arenilitoris]MBD2868658.1 CocE/NonD family hydrolase [Paenibacillus arenilitoris]